MKKQKISAMVVDFAWDYISEGNTRKERHTRLKTACTAWNYACVPEGVRAELLDKYIVEYRKWNPDADAEECLLFREELEELIRQKLAKYPEVNRQIISCELIPGKNQEQVYVVSAGETP